MEKEMRLIDADVLPVSKEYCVDEAGFGASFYVVHKDAIDNAPTVDAVEVVHAYWIGEEPGDWHCSHCGEYAADGGYEQTRYCPNCGAKMDGERKDNG